MAEISKLEQENEFKAEQEIEQSNGLCVIAECENKASNEIKVRLIKKTKLKAEDIAETPKSEQENEFKAEQEIEQTTDFVSLQNVKTKQAMR